MIRKRLLKVTIILLVAILGCLLYLFQDNRKVIEVADDKDITPVEIVDEFKEIREYYKQNKDINKDYIGDIYFSSGLINDSFVQAKSVYDENNELYTFYTQNGNLVKDPEGYNGNDVYIWKYWKTGEYDYNDHGGSVFMDYRNDLSDQNLIIYGHHFSVWNDETRTKAFTPLEQLLKKENYPNNKEINLLLENEIRTYELWAVYEYDVYDEDYNKNAQYWRYKYDYDDFTDTVDENYYQNYIDFILEKRLYDTDIELTTLDKTLTLQTCISGYTGELFEIVVFKLVDVTYFN